MKPEEKFLDQLEIFLQTYQNKFTPEELAMLLISQAGTLLAEAGKNPADTLTHVAAGIDFQAAKEVLALIEQNSSVLRDWKEKVIH